jgi:RNA-directed DNA polymerase
MESFDTISHAALMDRVRRRVGDKRVLGLVKAFLKAGILTEVGREREPNAGTPQGGILSPLLANVALSGLDEHFVKAWASFLSPCTRNRRRSKGLATYWLVRYADDLVVLVSGTRAHAEALREEVAAVLAPMGLRLSESKTKVVHLDEGFDFLGFRIRRAHRPGGGRQFVYAYPSKDALASIKRKVRTITRQGTNNPLGDLLRQLNSALRGWTTYFKYGVSSATFSYLRAFTWRRVICWLRRKHRGTSWRALRRRYFRHGWWPRDGDVILFNPGAVPIRRYRYRGRKIATPWAERPQTTVV